MRVYVLFLDSNENTGCYIVLYDGSTWEVIQLYLFCWSFNWIFKVYLNLQCSNFADYHILVVILNMRGLGFEFIIYASCKH